MLTLSVKAGPNFKGCKVYFTVVSGLTGKIRTAGSSYVGADGTAHRVLHSAKHQVLLMYAKLTCAFPFVGNPYTNSRAFVIG